jgi:transposase
VIEATDGYWAVDVLQACGASVHLAHPLGVEGRTGGSRTTCVTRVMWRTCCAWAACPRRGSPHPASGSCASSSATAELVALRSGLKAQVHAVLAKEGVAVPMRDLFGKHGMGLLAETRLGTCYRMRVDSLLELIDAFDGEVAFLSDAIAARLRHHPGYHAIQAIPGVGPTFAAVFTVEVGDITRFRRPAQLCSWAGVTPAITSRMTP